MHLISFRDGEQDKRDLGGYWETIMWDWIKKTRFVQPAGVNPERVWEATPLAPAGAASCCGAPMEQRLARARDRYGQVLFVTVRHCLRCGRTRL